MRIRKFLIRFVRWFFQSILGQEFSTRFIIFIHKASDVNLLRLGYRSIGILNYENVNLTGEKNILDNILKPYFRKRGIDPIIFDVGANVGNYTKMVQKIIPDSIIFSFEPNTISFEYLIKVNPNSFNYAVGNNNGDLLMYRESSNPTSTHFTSNKGFLSETKKTVEIKVKQKTLKTITNELSINQIHFLKIDTEGHDLYVLQGIDTQFLKKINFIQFEINEGLLDNRILLKDFYSMLQGFKLYRLLPNKILFLGDYSKNNEIFRFQNILAINEYIDIKCFKKFIC